MKKLVFGFLAVLMLVSVQSFGQLKENNSFIAAQKLLMVAAVEQLQKNAPVGTTATEFTTQLSDMKVSAEGKAFALKAFDYYKKGTSTKDILATYDGKEAKAIIINIKNGGVNPFGDLSTTARGGFLQWLINFLTGTKKIADHLIAICEIIPTMFF